MKNCAYDVEDSPPIKKLIPLSIQHVFAMFGSTILVPLLCGMSVNAAIQTGVHIGFSVMTRWIGLSL